VGDFEEKKQKNKFFLILMYKGVTVFQPIENGQKINCLR
jgi:hypothetical protein